MRSVSAAFIVAAMVCLYGVINYAGAAEKGQSGEAEFKEHCSMCHPNGSNIVNPAKGLHKAELMANNVRSATDIVKKMRNPGPGMTRFDAKTIPDADAIAIAEYVLKTFK